MSEYQYYEFRAIEEPLTAEQLKAVRAFSSRAEITPTSFTVTYNYGDFRGDPRKLMERYFDAHVYVSNFGSLHFMLRLPLNVIPEETLVQYAMGEVLEWWNTDEHTILDWQLNEESDGDWMEGEDWLDRMLPVRDELVRGDYRSLYLAWLSTLPGSSEEEDEDEEDYDDDLDEEDEEDAEEEDDDRYSTKRCEPPVPAGLQSLTEAQSALAEFLEIDIDLITAAAQESPKLTADANAADQMSEWVAQIPEQEVRAFVVRILNGESLRVQTELQSRYYRFQGQLAAASQGKVAQKGRTVAELLTIADQVERERKEKEAKEKDRKRRAHLAGLIPRLPELWTTVNELAAAQTGSSYDKASELLVDMRAAYGQAQRRSEFDAEFAKFLTKYSRSVALSGRLKKLGLMP